MKDLKEAYFNWMYEFIFNGMALPSYYRLIHKINETPFVPVLPMDENRVGDGINLRYQFGYEMHINDAIIAVELDNRPCSVLEMMVALAIRGEDIMSDSTEGNRTSNWLRAMLKSLGLITMSDDKYDETYVEDVLDRFVQQNYDRNGAGGLFTIPDYRFDLRNVEIWYQMNFWFVYISREGVNDYDP